MADVRFVVTFDDKGAYKSIKQFDGAIEDLGKTAPKTSSALGGLWKEFAKGMLAGASVAAAVHGISKAMRVLPAAFLDAAVVTENYTVRLETLLGSQKEAADAMSYFQEVAAKVPFTLEEVIDAGTKVTAFGLEFKKWTPIVADLAAVMGLSLPEAASALGRAFAGGAGAADIFRERGILNIIKDSALMKRGIDDLSKVTLPEFRDIMYETFTDPSGKIAGGADKLARTWSGTISMIQDKWFQFRQKVMEAGIFDTLKERLESLNEKLQEFVDSGKLEEWANRAAKGFDVLVRSMEELYLLADASAKGTGPAGAWADKITGGSRKMAEAVAAARRTVLEFRDSLEYAKPPMNEMREAMERGEKSWAAYTAAIRWHDAQLKKHAEVEAQMAKAAEESAKATTKQSGGIKTVTTSLTTALPKAREWVYLWTRYGMITKQVAETPLPGEGKLPEVQWQWLGFGETIVDTATVWQDAMLAMTAGLVSFGDANASVWSNIGSVFGNFVQSAISGLESLWLRQLLVSKGIVKAKQGEATASHIANIFKSVPFPLDLILAAGAFSVVNALFSKLLKFEKGGYFPSATMLPPHLVGEAGPEYYLPERMLEKTIERVIVKEHAGGAVNIVFANGAVQVYAQKLDDSVIDSLGPKLYRVIGDQMRIRGRRWN